jgi:hypothetical protein
MNYEEFSKPLLIEPGVKYFLSETLKQCREFKNKYNNILLNIGLFFLFVVILGVILLFKYKGKLTPGEKAKRNYEQQQYILSKIQNFQEAKKRASQELITGLPAWENEFDILDKK